MWFVPCLRYVCSMFALCLYYVCTMFVLCFDEKSTTRSLRREGHEDFRRQEERGRTSWGCRLEEWAVRDRSVRKRRGGRCGRPAVFQSLSNQVNSCLIFLSNSPYSTVIRTIVDSQVFERTAGFLQPAVRNMNT